jgi:hypothetical protein
MRPQVAGIVGDEVDSSFHVKPSQQMVVATSGEAKEKPDHPERREGIETQPQPLDKDIRRRME